MELGLIKSIAPDNNKCQEFLSLIRILDTYYIVLPDPHAIVRHPGSSAKSGFLYVFFALQLKFHVQTWRIVCTLQLLLEAQEMF
jgi:hypothetical protein